MSGDTWTTTARYDWEGNDYYSPLIRADFGGSARYHLYDGLGSTRQVLDQSQAVTDTYSYEAFGNLLGSTGSFPNPYRYVGSLGYYQTGSSLQHLGARYYLPEVGRFLQRDPLGAVSTEEGYGSYAYGDSNPVMRVDPDGKQWIEILVIIQMIIEGSTVVRSERTYRQAATLTDLCRVCYEEDCESKLENRRSGFGTCRSVTSRPVSRKGCEVTWETRTVTAACKLDKRSGRMQTLLGGKYVDCPASSRLGTRPPGVIGGPLD